MCHAVPGSVTYNNPGTGCFACRGAFLERAAARVCCKACAAVATYALLGDVNLVAERADDRRVEIIANGPLLLERGSARRQHQVGFVFGRCWPTSPPPASHPRSRAYSLLTVPSGRSCLGVGRALEPQGCHLRAARRTQPSTVSCPCLPFSLHRRLCWRLARLATTCPAFWPSHAALRPISMALLSRSARSLPAATSEAAALPVSRLPTYCAVDRQRAGGLGTGTP